MFNIFKNSGFESFQKELFSDNVDINVIEKGIKKGIDINKIDDKGRSVLFQLSLKHKLTSIKILLKNGVDINFEDAYFKNVLDYAISNSDGMMIRFLLENGSSVNHKNSSNRTILQNCAIEGSYKNFQILMYYNPDYDLKDNYGQTVLFDAVEGGSLKLLVDVINHVENLDLLDEKKETVLFSAVMKEDSRLAEALVKYGINLNVLNHHSQNVLFNAVLLGSYNIKLIKMMIEKGLNINQLNVNGDNILDEILYIQSLFKVAKDELVGKYKIINQNRNYPELVKVFIKNGLNIDKLDINGDTTLEKEIEEKNYENVEFLLECGANVNLKNSQGRTVLSKEILKGISNYRMIDFLIRNGASIDTLDNEQFTVIDYLVELILIQKGFKETSSSRFNDIVHNENYTSLLKKILGFRPNLSASREDGKNSLFDVVIYNDLELLKILVNYGVSVNTKDKEGNSPLTVLVESGLTIDSSNTKEKDLFLERLVFFLKFKVDVNIQDNLGQTVFHKAVLANDLAVVEKLLTKKANLSLQDKQGRTALLQTQWNGNYKIARWLISAGANMNDVDNSGFSLLNYAAIFGHTKLVITLIASGVLMYNRNPKSRKTAQFLKEKEKDLDKLLINNTIDDKMRKALEEVIENTRREINEVL
jgi:ankyrin repeat protein